MAQRKNPPEKKAPVTPAKTTAAKSRAAARDERVAFALVEGKSVTQIARDEKISRAWASAHANSPAVQQIIASLVNSERPRMHRLFVRCLEVIEQASHALQVVNYGGRRLALGPDHYARLTAGKRYLEFAAAGRAVPKEEESREDRPLTLEEIRRAVEAEKKGAVQ